MLFLGTALGAKGIGRWEGALHLNVFGDIMVFAGGFYRYFFVIIKGAVVIAMRSGSEIVMGAEFLRMVGGTLREFIWVADYLRVHVCE